MTYHSISEYLIAKNNYEQTPLRVIDGRMFDVIDGKEIEIFSLEKPHYEHLTISNPDKQNINTGCVSTKNK